MDFLDPKKQRAHALRLTIGYILIGVLLLLSTVILLYQAYGFGIDKNGQVIQNGLVFMSSQPVSGKIYINGVAKTNTSARLTLAAGIYTLQVQREGYRTWQRAVTVEGGSVQRFDYPILFPTTLKTVVTKQYAAAPTLVTESPNRHFVLIQASSPDQFDLYDLEQTPLAPRPLVIPSSILAAGSTTTGWQLQAWADDNRHVLLKRLYQKPGQTGSEYILVDRDDSTLSQNLTVALGTNPTTLALQDGNYDQYYVYDQNAAQLLTATLKKPTPVPLLQDVLAFATDGNLLAYVTADGASAGNVSVRLQQSGNTYTLRQLPAAASYAITTGTYSGARYVAAGSLADGRMYIYQDPVSSLSAKKVPVPVNVLKQPGVSWLAFSAEQRFIVAQNGSQFAVYDAETDKAYAYNVQLPIDAPQVHANWMDSAHLEFISSGQLQVFDYDGTNLQALSPASPQYLPVFNAGYKTLYTLTADNALTTTSLTL